MKHIIFQYNQLLAAEYVLGTLQGGSRRRYQYYLKQYPTLNQALEQWQCDLGSLADQLPEVKPKPELWHKIKKQL